MKYDFDEIIERKNTNSFKYEGARLMEPGLPEDFIPLWVADMDFACAQPILDAMKERIDKRILGYSDALNEGYHEAVIGWMNKRFHWEVKKEELRCSAGVVPALSNLVRLLTKKGDKVMFFTPSYGPFNRVTEKNGRCPVFCRLKETNGYYQIDFDDMKNKIEQEQVKLLILCSPHNPTGRVFTEEELRRIGDICDNHHVAIICDEIHHDLVRCNLHHISLASLYPGADWIYTCTAPSKTFNLAGNQLSDIVIPNKAIREIWDEKYSYMPNPVSLAATEAAYTKCEDWVEELNQYLDGNFKMMKEFLEEKLPAIRFEIPEGTYLGWMHMEGTGLDEQEIQRRFISQAGLFVEKGEMFVDNARFCIRVNVACPRAILKKALERMEKVFA